MWYLVIADVGFSRDGFDAEDYPWVVIDTDGKFMAEDLYNAAHEGIQEGLRLKSIELKTSPKDAHFALADRAIDAAERLLVPAHSESFSPESHRAMAGIVKQLEDKHMTPEVTNVA